MIIKSYFSFIRFSIFIFITCIFNTSLLAAPVSLNISDAITATGEYHKSNNNKPLIILIHGFLQTLNFSTVNRLHNELNDNDYSVLSINLSLGISNRQKALSCEALHLHSLTDDTKEISHWVNWAKQQGHKEIILIGHSAGSTNITAYLSGQVHPLIKKTILISLTHYGPDRPAAFETEEQAIKARLMQQKGNNNLAKFSLSFCKQYTSTAAKFLSYYEWNDAKTLKAVNTKNPKNYVIIGGKDNRIDTQWINAMQNSKTNITIIDGANHFFDQTHEFDLLEAIENIIENE